mgnify:CR=1 FL=1
MSKKARKIENVPTTDILWAVSRTGYNFNEALGDIIDNSVDAHRQKYKEQKHKDGFIRATCLSWQQNKKNHTRDKPRYIIIADNATGIEPKALEDVFNMGQSDKRGESLLGTFGVGLKTSALALGDIVTVITTVDNIKNLKANRWDTPKSKKAGKWEVEYYEQPKKEHIEFYKNYVGDCAGTLVLIENLKGEVVPASSSSANKSLGKYCARIYRHIIDPADLLGYHVPIEIYCGVSTQHNSYGRDPLQPLDPLCADSQHTKFCISDGHDGFKEIEYPINGYKFKLRMLHYSDDSGGGSARRFEKSGLSNLGAGITGQRKTGMYFHRGGREIYRERLWGNAAHLTNVYAELAFDDAGLGSKDELIQANFGKIKVNIDEDFAKWVTKNYIKLQLSKLAADSKKRIAEKKLAGQKPLKEKICEVPLPEETFGKTKVISNRAKAAASVFQKPEKKTGENKHSRKNKKGTYIKINDEDNIHIDYEEVSWRGSQLPYDVQYTVGDKKCVILINTEHEVIQEKIYDEQDKARGDQTLQLITSFAAALLHEEEEERHSIITKQAVLWSLLPTEGDTEEVQVENLEPPSVISARDISRESESARTRGPSAIYKEMRFAPTQS